MRAAAIFLYIVLASALLTAVGIGIYAAFRASVTAGIIVVAAVLVVGGLLAFYIISQYKAFKAASKTNAEKEDKQD